jgi:putative ABC transport system substrate-binding protein
MKRRTVLQLCASVAASPRLLAAQDAKRFRVGLLATSNETAAKFVLDPFYAGLRQLGYVAGSNLALDVRYAEGDYSRLEPLGTELIALKPDVLVGIEPAVAALRRRTQAIPLVLLESTDPVASGLVQSLARPGTNVTGIAYRHDELAAKLIELLRELRPQTTRVGLLIRRPTADDPVAGARERTVALMQATASKMGLEVVAVEAGKADEVAPAFAQLQRERAEGIVVMPSGVTWLLRREIVAEARRLRIPAVSSLQAGFADAGGLATYGPNAYETYRYAAGYVDRILKGANPAEMPLEQPSGFELVLNLRTAREIGIKVPQSVLLRAGRVIE